VIQLMLLLVALSPVVFLIGLVKPGWILFWVKQPDRLWASSVGIIMFMATFTAYSEMRVRHKAETEGVAAHDGRSADQRNQMDLGGMR
jgi:hypothetical protein